MLKYQECLTLKNAKWSRHTPIATNWTKESKNAKTPRMLKYQEFLSTKNAKIPSVLKYYKFLSTKNVKYQWSKNAPRPKMLLYQELQS